LKKKIWHEIMDYEFKETDIGGLGYANALNKNDLLLIYDIIYQYQGTDKDVNLAHFNLGICKYKIFDYLARCIDGLMDSKKALKVLLYAYLKADGDIRKFILELNRTDFDIFRDWEKIDLDTEIDDKLLELRSILEDKTDYNLYEIRPQNILIRVHHDKYSNSEEQIVGDLYNLSEKIFYHHCGIEFGEKKLLNKYLRDHPMSEKEEFKKYYLKNKIFFYHGICKCNKCSWCKKGGNIVFKHYDSGLTIASRDVFYEHLKTSERRIFLERNGSNKEKQIVWDEILKECIKSI